MGPVLVTGGSGQVGQALQRLGGQFDIVAPPRSELDLADTDALTAAVASRPWAAVVNSGAYTAVDKAESDVITAWKINALAPAALAAATRSAGIPLIQVSTDYVFDGDKPSAYVEDDPVKPLGVYGASKEAGEQAVRTANPAHVILRTAWVVSPDGANFIKTMLRLGADRPELRVVADQKGCPTTAADIAAAIGAILGRLGPDGPFGTYHFVNSGEATWHALAEAVFDRAASHGRARPHVAAITTADYPTPAKRPANSQLDTQRFVDTFGLRPRLWRDAIDEVVDQLISKEPIGA